ncbi:hypothetical protein AAFN88_14975 [Pelagibius sp. CAU 1746]|uniref:tellurite resistance TerB family protein n=1 Tax=Pelagibius sp. CAU 1746 TaxID=3140370 RepID=UPI00325BFBE2
MYVQVLKLITARPLRSVTVIPDFEPALTDSDDVFAEDAEGPFNFEALLTDKTPTDPLADLDDGAVGGLSFAMEYRDSRNAMTRRRITLNGFRPTEGGHYLMRAFCHERKAVRSFRTDRIVSIIDWDGVIWEPLEYFDDLGIRLPLPVGAITAPKRAEPRPGESQRAACADELCILAALSRSDGHLHDYEVERMLDFTADACDRQGLPFEESDRAALDRYIRKLCPDITAVGECLVRLNRREDSVASKRLFRAMVAVMDADGVQAPEEVAFITEVDCEMDS